MKLIFRHRDHAIMVSRGVTSAELSIDNEIQDVINGFTNTQMKSFELNGKVKNEDGSFDDVRVCVEIGLPNDTVSCYFNGELIDAQKTIF